MVLRSDPSVAVRALRSAAPYIRMYKGKVFVIKASGGVFGDIESDSHADRAGRDPASGRHSRRARARRRTAAVADSRVAGHHAAHGRGPSRHRREVHGSHEHGAQRPREHADSRHLPRAGYRRGRRERRRCGPGARSQASAGAGRRPDRRLRFRRRHRFDRCEGAAAVARRRLDAGREPGVRRRQGHAAEHQRRHGCGRHRRRAEGGEADAGAPARPAFSSRSKIRARSFRTPISPA